MERMPVVGVPWVHELHHAVPYVIGREDALVLYGPLFLDQNEDLTLVDPRRMRRPMGEFTFVSRGATCFTSSCFF